MRYYYRLRKHDMSPLRPNFQFVHGISKNNILYWFNRGDSHMLSPPLTFHTVALGHHVTAYWATRACNWVSPTVGPQVFQCSFLSEGAEWWRHGADEIIKVQVGRFYQEEWMKLGMRNGSTISQVSWRFKTIHTYQVPKGQKKHQVSFQSNYCRQERYISKH